MTYLEKRPTNTPIAAIKGEQEEEFVSPVLSYLGATTATPGQGGLLHGLLSPPSASASNPLLPFSTKVIKTPQEKSRRKSPKPKSKTPKPVESSGSLTKVVDTPSMSVANPMGSSFDLSRQVAQHTQIIQKHLTQIQQASLSSGSPQLLRLLSPNAIPSAPVPVLQPQQPVQFPFTSKPATPSTSKVSMASELNVTVVNPPAAPIPSISTPSLSSVPCSMTMLEEKPQTALISRQQLVSGLTTPIVRLTKPDTPTTNTPMSISTPSMSMLPPRPVAMPVLSENVQANVFLKAADKTIAASLRQSDLKALFDGGIVRFVVPAEGGQQIPVNIILKQPLGSTQTVASTTNPSPGTSTVVTSSVTQESDTKTPVDVNVSPGSSKLYRPKDIQGNPDPQVPVSVLMPGNYGNSPAMGIPVSTPTPKIISNMASLPILPQPRPPTSAFVEQPSKPEPDLFPADENLKIVAVKSLAPPVEPQPLPDKKNVVKPGIQSPHPPFSIASVAEEVLTKKPFSEVHTPEKKQDAKKPSTPGSSDSSKANKSSKAKPKSEKSTPRKNLPSETSPKTPDSATKKPKKSKTTPKSVVAYDNVPAVSKKPEKDKPVPSTQPANPIVEKEGTPESSARSLRSKPPSATKRKSQTPNPPEDQGAPREKKKKQDSKTSKKDETTEKGKQKKRAPSPSNSNTSEDSSRLTRASTRRYSTNSS